MSRSGSPPLAREQPSASLPERLPFGITPACAGTTCRLRESLPLFRDHPRLRGNNSSVILITSLILGSPPLAREQLASTVWDSVTSGITPACAGTTLESNNRIFQLWDHPRLRGNNLWGMEVSVQRAGSPPLAREQRFAYFILRRLIRITPACAGTTYQR